MERIICLAIGYIFGLFQTGYLYSKSKNVDIKSQGSGNSGTTNVVRTMGFKAGVITFVGDCLKSVFVMLLIRFVFRNDVSQSLVILALYGGVGAVLGHNFPFYMNFKGGKGVATSVGVALVTNFWLAIIALITYYSVMKITKYVSVGSMSLLGVFAFGTIIYDQCFGMGLSTVQLQFEIYGIVIGLFVLCIFMHRENIKKLKNGTENKIKSARK